MSAERTAWLRLARTDGVGPVTFFKMIERFGEAEAALDALPDLARKAGRAQAPRIWKVAAGLSIRHRRDRAGG